MQKICIWTLVNGQNRNAFILKNIKTRTACACSVSFRIKAFRFCPFHSCCSWLEQSHSWATVGGVCGRGVGRTLGGNVCLLLWWGSLDFGAHYMCAVCRGCLLMFLIAVAASYVQTPLSILSALRPGGRIELAIIPQLISILILLNTDTLWRW